MVESSLLMVFMITEIMLRKVMVFLNGVNYGIKVYIIY